VVSVVGAWLLLMEGKRDGRTIRRWKEFCVRVLWERDGRKSYSSSRVVLVSPPELKTSSSSGRSWVFSSRSRPMSGMDGRLGGRLLGAIAVDGTVELGGPGLDRVCG
jgi:hypothetical protein